MRLPAIFFVIFSTSFAWTSCDKNVEGEYQLSYGDSILYLKPGSGNQLIYPTIHREGVYHGFPEGIEIDDKTGAINISNSETGLRYRITHTAPGGKETTTLIVVSGITFKDKFYHLSSNDTIAAPIYNADANRILPVSGSVFDEGGIAGTSGCDIKTLNGQINLAQSVRNGLFGTSPLNDERRDVEILYRLNDGSGKALNKIKVRLYYYTSMATVAPDLLETLSDRDALGVFLRNNGSHSDSANLVTGTAKPRPPCVIIIAN